MLPPLNQFICDTCGEIIQSPDDGWLEWVTETDDLTGKSETHSFNIVHHISSSPYASSSKDGCYQHGRKKGLRDLPLRHYIDENYKMAHILSFLDIGPLHQPKYKGTDLRDLREFVEIMRRLTIPHYEEARLYWDDAKADGYFSDSNEIWPYGIETLQEIISKYG